MRRTAQSGQSGRGYCSKEKGSVEMSLARLRQLSEVKQRRAACMLGAIVADTAGETLRLT